MQQTSVAVPDLDTVVPPAPGRKGPIVGPPVDEPERPPWEGRDVDVRENRAGRFSQDPRMFQYGVDPELQQVATALTGLSLLLFGGLWVLDPEVRETTIIPRIVGIMAAALLLTRVIPKLWPLPRPTVHVGSGFYHLGSRTQTNLDDTQTTFRTLEGGGTSHILPWHFALPFADRESFFAEVCSASWRGQTRLLWVRPRRPSTAGSGQGA